MNSLRSRTSIFAVALLLLLAPARSVLAQKGAPTDGGQRIEPETVSVLGSASTFAGINDAAVVVGVGDYVFVSDIAGAADNATDWYKWLREARAVPQEHINLLRNHEATLENLQEALSKATKEVGEGGTLWFVFIGHGAPGLDGTEGVLVGADAQQNPRSLYARSLSQSALASALAGGAQQRSVLVLDTCFSGRDAAGNALVADLQPLVPTAASVAPKRTIMLTAAGSDEFAGPLPSTGRPAFSYLMLGALGGWADANGDGSVTVGEAIDYTQHALTVLVTDRSQRPELVGGDRGAVLSVGQTEKGPNLDDLKLAPGAMGALVGTGLDSNVIFDGAPQAQKPPLPVMFRMEYGFRWLGTTTFAKDVVEFQSMQLSEEAAAVYGDSSDYLDLEVSELSGTLLTNYAGFTTHNNSEGFGWGVSFGFTWTSDTDVTANLTADESIGSEPADDVLENALRKGYTARISGLYITEINIEPHYLLRYDPASFEVGVGFGGYLGGIGVAAGPAGQPVEGVSSTSAIVYGWTIPIRAIASVKVYENWAGSLIYMYHLMPFDSHSIILGVGPSFY